MISRSLLTSASGVSAFARATASGRTTTTAVASLPRIAAPLLLQQRGITSSSQRRAEASHGSASAEGDEHNTHEGFSAPIWRNTLFLLIGGVVLYRVSELQRHPSPSHASSSGHSSPDNAVPSSSASSSHDDEEEEQDNRPWLTRYLAYYTTPIDVYKERNLKHLDLVREQAENRLLFQDAERPPIFRYRYPATFEQASPHGLAVGAQADLSDLKVKKDNE